ncbi:helix-turn-helix DNA binding domain protein [Gordonia phage Whitney]|nr:helix-turn-helix DNA binding domain protein [Gordonia phage Whitney]
MSADKLTPTEELFMEVLSARIRLGEPWWTFESNGTNRVAAKNLEAKGLVSTMSGQVERTFRADLTEQAKAEWLDDAYTSPIARRAETYKVERDSAIEALDALHRSLEPERTRAVERMRRERDAIRDIVERVKRWRKEYAPCLPDDALDDLDAALYGAPQS